MAIGVMKARKQYGVEFPSLYALESNPNKKEFDSVQRGHQNVLESIPIFLAVQACVALAAGPLVAAGLITVWTVAKVIVSSFGGVGGRGSFFRVFFLGSSRRSMIEKKLTLSLSFSLPSLSPFLNHKKQKKQWVYFDGYAKGGPKGRIPGAAVSSLVQLISTIVVLVVGVKSAVKLLPL